MPLFYLSVFKLSISVFDISVLKAQFLDLVKTPHPMNQYLNFLPEYMIRKNILYL